MGSSQRAPRDPARAGLYSFENRHVTLDAAFKTRFRAKARAWKFFDAQPPGYKRLAAFWVMSAKREETRERRFTTLVDDSGKGARVASLVFEPCTGFEALRADAGPEERAYAEYLDGRGTRAVSAEPLALPRIPADEQQPARERRLG